MALSIQQADVSWLLSTAMATVRNGNIRHYVLSSFFNIFHYSFRRICISVTHIYHCSHGNQVTNPYEAPNNLVVSHVSVGLSCVPVYISFCLSVCPSVCMSLLLSVCMSFCLYVSPSVCLYVLLSVCLSFCLSVCPSVCMSLLLSVCMSVLPVCSTGGVTMGAGSRPWENSYLN